MLWGRYAHEGLVPQQASALFEGANAWDHEKGRPKKQAPKTARKGAQLAPDLHAVTGVVVANDVCFGAIVLACDGPFFHVEPRSLEFFFDARGCLVWEL